jgi:CheY-like chemotaxis protein
MKNVDGDSVSSVARGEGARKALEDEDTLPGIEGAIVVVDDNEDLRDLIQRALESDGYHVYTASAGREALAALARMPRPRLVVLDVSMPGMNGLEVLDAMKAAPALADVPVALLTGHSDIRPIRGVRILSKPIEIEPLLRAVRETVEYP